VAGDQQLRLEPVEDAPAPGPPQQVVKPVPVVVAVGGGRVVEAQPGGDLRPGAVVGTDEPLPAVEQQVGGDPPGAALPRVGADQDGQLGEHHRLAGGEVADHRGQALAEPDRAGDEQLEHDPGREQVAASGDRGQPHQGGEDLVAALQVGAVVDRGPELVEAAEAGEGGLLAAPADERLGGGGGGDQVLPLGVQPVDEAGGGDSRHGRCPSRLSRRRTS
jgi:hypothetical protein